jgi:hypothetical protein
MTRRSKWWGDMLRLCQGCGGQVTDWTRYIAGGQTWTLCGKCLERNLAQDNERSRMAEYYTP